MPLRYIARRHSCCFFLPSFRYSITRTLLDADALRFIVAAVQLLRYQPIRQRHAALPLFTLKRCLFVIFRLPSARTSRSDTPT